MIVIDSDCEGGGGVRYDDGKYAVFFQFIPFKCGALWHNYDIVCENCEKRNKIDGKNTVFFFLHYRNPENQSNSQQSKLFGCVNPGNLMGWKAKLH